MPEGLAQLSAWDPRRWRERLLERHRRGYEVAILLTTVLGALLVGLGNLAATVNVPHALQYGMWAGGAGLALVTVSMALSRGIPNFRSLGRKTTGGSRYDQLRHWTRLKASGILLSLLTGLSAAVLLGSLLFRIDPVEVSAPLPLVFRLATLLTLIVVLIQASCHYLSLRTPLERRPETGFEVIFAYLGFAGVLTFALLAAVLATRPLSIPGLTTFQPADAPFFLLASATLASATLFIARSVPTVAVLFMEERDYYAGQTYLSKSKSVVMPAMMAFGLLFLIVLVLLVFGVGIAGLVEDIPRNTVLLGVFGLIVAAMMTSIAATFLLSRSEDRATLYRTHRTADQRKVLLLLGSSGAATTVLLLVAAALFLGGPLGGIPGTRWLDFVCFALLVALGPYGFHVAARYRRIRLLEERFPDFLRDLAASRRAGLTLTEAVRIASKGEYGALTPEIVKMADQLSWNVPFDETLLKFGERVRTPLVQRAVSLISEASRTGGNVTDVLLAASRDAREIKNLETERRTTMSLYTVVIYITFFVFLSVIAILYGTFIPEILKTSQAVLAGGTGGLGGASFGKATLEDYRVFYFLAALVQGLGNGFVAGLMGSGRPLDGLRHSFAMVLISWVTFAVVVTPGA